MKSWPINSHKQDAQFDSMGIEHLHALYTETTTEDVARSEVTSCPLLSFPFILSFKSFELMTWIHVADKKPLGA